MGQTHSEPIRNGRCRWPPEGLSGACICQFKTENCPSREWRKVRGEPSFPEASAKVSNFLRKKGLAPQHPRRAQTVVCRLKSANSGRAQPKLSPQKCGHIAAEICRIGLASSFGRRAATEFPPLRIFTLRPLSLKTFCFSTQDII